MSNDSIGDRMKTYEEVSRPFLTRRIPVIVRIDGKAFHTYTKGMNRPFDQPLIDAMVNSAIEVAKQMQGFKFGYVQSDEASFLLLDTDSLTTEAWFANNLSKIISVSASLMTGHFNTHKLKDVPAFFDARAFNIPLDDVANYFLWRAKDWERNSIQMYCRSFFSQKQLNGKNREAMHEMLHQIGKNWATDLSDQIKNGTWLRSIDSKVAITHDMDLSYSDIDETIRKSI